MKYTYEAPIAEMVSFDFDSFMTSSACGCAGVYTAPPGSQGHGHGHGNAWGYNNGQHNGHGNGHNPHDNP